MDRPALMLQIHDQLELFFLDYFANYIYPNPASFW